MYLFLPGCPSFHRFMVVYHDLSIYPSIPAIHPSQIVYFQLFLNRDCLISWPPLLGLLSSGFHGQLCPYHAKTQVTLWDSLNSVKCINCTGFVSCMKILSGPRGQEDQAKSRCLIVSWVSFSAKTSMTSFKFQTHSENACKWKMSQFCKRTTEMTSLIASGSTLLIGPLAFVIARDIPNSQASRILFPHYDS